MAAPTRAGTAALLPATPTEIRPVPSPAVEESLRRLNDVDRLNHIDYLGVRLRRDGSRWVHFTMPSEDGKRRYELTINLASRDSTCNCLGGRYSPTCKHQEALRVMCGLRRVRYDACATCGCDLRYVDPRTRRRSCYLCTIAAATEAALAARREVKAVS